MVPFRPSLKYSSTEALLMLIREVAMLISWLKEIFLSVSKRQSCKKMNQFKFSCSANSYSEIKLMPKGQKLSESCDKVDT